MRKTLSILFGAVIAAQSYSAEALKLDSKSVYTLYRNSALNGGEKMRLHVATFDSVDGAEYNRDNCEIAKQLFKNQPGVSVNYWCERGYFRKK